MTGSGFLLGIPVFFDTLFYLMIPLAKSLGLRDRKQYGLLVMSIIAGGTMAHSLIPYPRPTPGRQPASGARGLDDDRWTGRGPVHLLDRAGLRSWANQKWPLPMRDSGGITLRELEDQAQVADADLPPYGHRYSPSFCRWHSSPFNHFSAHGALRKRCIARGSSPSRAGCA